MSSHLKSHLQPVRRSRKRSLDQVQMLRGLPYTQYVKYEDPGGYRGTWDVLTPKATTAAGLRSYAEIQPIILNTSTPLHAGNET